MNTSTQLVSDDRLETQIKMAEAQKNDDLMLLLVELKQYRVIGKVQNNNKG